MGVKPSQPSGTGMVPQKAAGLISSVLLGISLEVHKHSLTWAPCPHTGTHYSPHLGLNCSTPSSMLSLFWTSILFFNPLGSFPFMSRPPSSRYVLYFWVHVSMPIFTLMSVFPATSTQVEVLHMALALHQALCGAVYTEELTSFIGLEPVLDNSQSPQSSAMVAGGQLVWFSLELFISAVHLARDQICAKVLNPRFFTAVSSLLSQGCQGVVCHDLNKLRTIKQSLISHLG